MLRGIAVGIGSSIPIVCSSSINQLISVLAVVSVKRYSWYRRSFLRCTSASYHSGSHSCCSENFLFVLLLHRHSCWLVKCHCYNLCYLFYRSRVLTRIYGSLVMFCRFYLSNYEPVYNTGSQSQSVTFPIIKWFLIIKAVICLGGALGYIIGGGISDAYGWRWAFRVSYLTLLACLLNVTICWFPNR